jgi:hypothetical protein
LQAFISYNENTRDAAIAASVAEVAREFFSDVFFAGDKNEPISTLEQTLVSKTIRDQLKNTDVLIVIGSQKYLDSFWGNLELNIALEIISQNRKIAIIPFWIDAAPIDPFLAALNATMLEGFDSEIVSRRLKRETERPQESTHGSNSVQAKSDKEKWEVREEPDFFFALLDRHEARLSRQQKKENQPN